MEVTLITGERRMGMRGRDRKGAQPTLITDGTVVKRITDNM